MKIKIPPYVDPYQLENLNMIIIIHQGKMALYQESYSYYVDVVKHLTQEILGNKHSLVVPIYYLHKKMIADHLHI